MRSCDGTSGAEGVIAESGKWRVESGEWKVAKSMRYV